MDGPADVGVPGVYDPLPADTTSFVGRRSEIAEVRRTLSVCHVLTLTGPGGVGKTRLALRVAARVRRAFRAGICLVELAELRDPALLSTVVAEKLGLREQAGRDPLDTIIEHLRDRQLLLVLDNCEHLVDECAVFVDALIKTCSGVRVLATSRQSLRIAGERIMTVLPLPVPDPERAPTPESIRGYESVDLCVDRATAVAPGFEVSDGNCAVLARLCRELDGIPLAIELAAARLSSFSLEQIEERLTERYRLLTIGMRTAPSRQRTLRALIDWSYELCTERERLVWRRVSVFSGSFELDAAEYVCGGESVAVGEVFGVVASLVDKSVLLREEAAGIVRYRLLETVREYGQEKLVAAGERGTVRRRHRDWYARMVERMDEGWSAEQAAWLNRLRLEHANLRVALDFCVAEPGEAAVGMRMAVRMGDYWGVRGLQTQARHWLARALAIAPEPTGERASALREAAWLAALQGDIEAARALLDEAEQVAQRSGDQVESAYVIHNRGMVANFTGQMDRAVRLLRDGLSRFRALGVARGEMFAQFGLGMTLGMAEGREQEAIGLLEECQDAAARAGEIYWRGYFLWTLAYVHIRINQVEQAETACKSGLRLQRELDNRLAMAGSMDTLACVTQRLGASVRAARLFGAADTLWQEVGASPDFYVMIAAVHREHVALARAALGDGRYDEEFRRGRRLSLSEAVEYALEVERQEKIGLGARETDDGLPQLTPREWEIAELVADGLSNRQIATGLVIAQRTAEAHVEHILVKLGFTARTQIAAWVAARMSPSRS